ncbi:hypothetical protein Desdi_1389 [Desulfitobacterium dichloroeliminans LMG P-21439]|uniref:Uncharacterized protein n=1 Tax=Desulfitobacterium dichloroeliminans (strain LMG P-21439 / DCA1) TaxID=871963 RepID=L0F7F5_DESDL|nr:MULTISPECIES: hypothetical protein [Desulfitobacteriaceae]AGA68893.1 hypothetical protein Desdi_1389 [Desulfitobacterium dichloroeliminans LMG P-21439]
MADTKVYVPVMTAFDKDGILLPLELTWEGGSTYLIDRVIHIRPAAEMKAGGQGDRYTISVNGQQGYLFFQRNASIRQ